MTDMHENITIMDDDVVRTPGFLGEDNTPRCVNDPECRQYGVDRKAYRITA